jgi:hypothetical protein
MKSKKVSVKKTSVKKAQNGTKSGASTATSDGNIWTGVVRRPTAGGPRYYTGESPDYNIAMRIAQSKAGRQGADSTKRTTLTKMQLEELGEKKRKGGVVRKSTPKILKAKKRK